MEEIVTILSTREWAITIWGTGFFIWMLTQSEIRKSLWNVIKILLGKNLRRFFLIIALYVAGITMIFYQLPFWNNIYLKDIILWLIFSGISYCVNSIIKGDTEHLKSTVKDNFRVIVIFEYFIGTFTFKFWIEMLIIPVITILTLMNVVAESEEKYRGVHKLIDIVLACIGWYMLWGAVNVGLKEYKELNAINTLVSFMIPIVYTILILPLEFGLEIYSDYEQVFVRMKFRDNQDKKIQRKHRWRVIRTCKLSLRKILLFRKEYVNKMYPRHREPDEKEDNIRIYVPMDLNKDAILRRLDNIIGLYGEAREDNEIEFSIDVGMIISQLEIYDQIWFVRHMPKKGEHSREAKELVTEIIARLEDIPDGCAECFPFELIDELKQEYLTDKCWMRHYYL